MENLQVEKVIRSTMFKKHASSNSDLRSRAQISIFMSRLRFDYPASYIFVLQPDIVGAELADLLNLMIERGDTTLMNIKTDPIVTAVE